MVIAPATAHLCVTGQGGTRVVRVPVLPYYVAPRRYYPQVRHGRVVKLVVGGMTIVGPPTVAFLQDYASARLERAFVLVGA